MKQTIQNIGFILFILGVMGLAGAIECDTDAIAPLSMAVIGYISIMITELIYAHK